MNNFSPVLRRPGLPEAGGGAVPLHPRVPPFGIPSRRYEGRKGCICGSSISSTAFFVSACEWDVFASGAESSVLVSFLDIGVSCTSSVFLKKTNYFF